MEIAFGIEPSKLLFTQRDLLDAARQSTVDTFGWPIGVLLNREDARPRPTGSGVHAEVAFELGSTEQSFDLWELRTNGDFYTILSLFEDQRQHGEELFFDTRIVRVAEAFLYCGRLYTNLGVPRDAQIHMTIKHGGLEGRTLTASSPGRRLSMGYTSDVDISEVSLGFALGEIDAALTDLVRRVTGPLFELFDFFRLGAEVHDDIVDRFVRGDLS